MSRRLQALGLQWQPLRAQQLHRQREEAPGLLIEHGKEQLHLRQAGAPFTQQSALAVHAAMLSQQSHALCTMWLGGQLSAWTRQAHKISKL